MRDGSIFTSAVIDAQAYDRIISYIEHARSGADGAEIIFGGTYDNSKGFFIQPTLVTVINWDSKLLTEVNLSRNLLNLPLVLCDQILNILGKNVAHVNLLI